MRNLWNPVLRTSTVFTLFALLILIFTPRIHAQIGDAGEILRAGTDDSNLLMENYLKPFGAGFGADINSGWFNSAAPYQPFGFDMRLSASLAFVPESDQLFNAAAIGMTQVNRYNGQTADNITEALSPTIAGDDITGTRIGRVETVQGEEVELFDFHLPQGTGFPYVPSPMIQLTVGAGFDTDVSVRFVPTVEVSDVASIGMWGLGVRHGLNRWIPGGETLPVDLSVQMGYTRLIADASFDVQPAVDGDTYVPQGLEPESPRWQGQGLDLEASGFTSNLLVGRSFPIISFYGGVGFQTSTMNIRTPGSYPITSPNLDYTIQQTGEPQYDRTKVIEAIDAPIDLSLDGSNSVHALAGFRIRLAILTISGSYTVAKYPVANLGVGISFR